MVDINSSITQLKQISEHYSKKLNKLGIFTIRDFITYFPRDYVDSSEIITIKDLLLEQDTEKKYTISVKIESFQNIFTRNRKTFQKVVISDQTGHIEANFFNQKYLDKVFVKGAQFYFHGKIKKKGNKIFFSVLNYEQILANRENTHLARIAPEYHLTAGVHKKWFRNRMKNLMDNVISDSFILPNELDFLASTQKLKGSILTVHFPNNYKELTSSQQLLSLYELVNIFLKVIHKNKNQIKHHAPPILKTEPKLSEFLAMLPFDLTNDQLTIIKKLEYELHSGRILNELIQGDVGTGKTVIALYLSYFIAKQGYQTVILAPTTVLAKQHYNTFLKTFSKTSLTVELVSSENKKSVSTDILIGTSAVLARKKKLIKKLGLIIVDEQHRFGVQQREELLKPVESVISQYNYVPHFVNMTATPIPRTIAETFFSDLSVRTIKSKPKGRKEIKSFIVPEEKRENSYEWIRDQILNEGIQVYWLAPLVEESDVLQARSAKETYEQLKKIYKGFKIGLLHGKMSTKDKQDVMDKFSQNKIHILVSTSVIEVGIDVPNATIMVVENAERFGLAQLHQIRGRVGRGDKQSYFFMFSGSDISIKSKSRLEFIASNNDGLEVAKFDLAQRGPGEVYGIQQSGIPNLKIAKLNNLDSLKEAKVIALKAYGAGIRNITLFN